MSMTQYAAPGVYVTEQLLATTPASQVTSPSVAGFAGEHYQGPVGVAIQCRRWQDFVNYFGGFPQTAHPEIGNSWLPYAVYEFFNNGGTSAWINRIATGGTAATLILKDSSATPQGTLQLTAGFLGINNSIGTWGNNLSAMVTSSTLTQQPGTFNLTIFYGNPGVAVEQWTNLSMVPNSPRYAPVILNSVTSGSLYVYAQALGTAHTPPAPTVSGGNPVALQFTPGTDPTAPPTSLQKQAAMTYGTCGFDVVPGVLNINMPGETDTATIGAAIGYCEPAPVGAGRPYSFLVIDPPQGYTPANVISSYMQAIQGINNTSFGALYYPWVNANNPASSSLGSTVLMPPGGFVLGAMANVDKVNGPWYAPAGIKTALSGAVGLERLLSPHDRGALNLANVNALITVPNTGQVVIFGARTLQTQYADVYVPIRRTLNYIEAQLGELLQFALFQPNNTILWTTITAACTQFLAGIAGRDAFEGQVPKDQYYVICDETNNPPSSVTQGVVNTTVGVALNYPAEFLQLTITQFQSSGTTTVQTTF